MKNVHALRHEKEKNYYTFMMVVSVIVWLLCLVGVLAALVFCLPLILIGLFFMATDAFACGAKGVPVAETAQEEYIEYEPLTVDIDGIQEV